MTFALAAGLYYKLGATTTRGLVAVAAGVAGLGALFWVQARFGAFAPDIDCTLAQKLTMRPESCGRGVAAAHGVVIYGLAAIAASWLGLSRAAR